MRQLAPREKALVAFAVTALVIFAYVFGLLLPERRALGDARRWQGQLKDQLAQAELMYREAAAAQQQVAALGAQSQSIMFGSSDVQSGMVTEIEKVSKELGVAVTSIRPGDPDSADGSTKHPAVFKVETDLGNIVRLLYELEQPGRRLWVEGVEITSARKTGGALAATIYVAVYSPSHESEAKNGEA